MIPLVGMIFTSCTDVERLDFEHIGGYNTMNNGESEAYYANLRAYKETANDYNRPVAFGWFSNWAPAGVIRKGYLSSVPDSMDIVSMWSGAPGRYEITEAQKEDKEFVQKVKGTKMLCVAITRIDAETDDHAFKQAYNEARAMPNGDERTAALLSLIHI